MVLRRSGWSGMTIRSRDGSRIQVPRLRQERAASSNGLRVHVDAGKRANGQICPSLFDPGGVPLLAVSCSAVALAFSPSLLRTLPQARR